MSDIQLNHVTIGTITVNEQGIRGEGGPHDPRLVIPLALTMHPQPAGAMLALIEMRCALHVTSPTSESNQIGQTATLHLLDNLGTRSQTLGPISGRVEVRIALNEPLLAFLEAHRHNHPEGIFEAYLDMHATTAWVRETGNVTPPEILNHPIDRYAGPFSVLAPFWYTRIGDLSLHILASHWVDRVLPPLGFSSLRLIEVALPAKNGFLPEAFLSAFDAALQNYDLGSYRECIQKCRDVRTIVEHHLGATSKHSVADVISDRLGLPADAPQSAFLRSAWKGFADLTNAAHHLSTVQGMVRADAHVCLLTAALLVEYISQLR